jgi:hypothetical protein
MESGKTDKEIRPAYGWKVLTAFLLATIAFVLIFVLGYSISYLKYHSVLQTQENLRYDLLSFEIERELLEESCVSFDPYRFSDEMDNMGKSIGLLEQMLGKSDSGVLSQKKTYSLLELNDKEKELIIQLGNFKEVVQNACRNLSPNLIANYAYELSQMFNEFYHSEQVIGSDNEQFKLVLVDSFSQVLKNALSLLGINTLEKM